MTSRGQVSVADEAETTSWLDGRGLSSRVRRVPAAGRGGPPPAQQQRRRSPSPARGRGRSPTPPRRRRETPPRRRSRSRSPRREEDVEPSLLSKRERAREASPDPVAVGRYVASLSEDARDVWTAAFVQASGLPYSEVKEDEEMDQQ